MACSAESREMWNLYVRKVSYIGPIMPDKQAKNSVNKDSSDNSNQLSPPTINLPKGGGSIRGIGEKFAANPVTGTGSLSVPIATSPGRSGFGPQLSLTYNSGSGNGSFGFGWNLSLPSITRKTDKGLPQYRDTDESDVFLLSGAEDLVPLLNQDDSRFADDTSAPDYIIHRYRPRIEGLFARIERWTKKAGGDVHWRSISKENILTLYGKKPDSRISDPEDPTRIFSWLICETRDDKGNAVLYEYKAEDGAGADLTRVHERNRGAADDPRRTANRYLKHIRYGNRASLLDDADQRPRFLSEEQLLNAGWMFEVVFDYGEHDIDTSRPNDSGQWLFRTDPFSNYRAGFEVRTTRLCQRVLMFHHFDGEEGVGNDCLVRSTDFTYSHERNPDNSRNPIYTFLQTVTQTGYQRNGDGYLKRSLPPIEFEYTQPIVQKIVEEVDPASLDNLPIGVDGAAYQWTDLHGEGIPGILTEQANEWYYKRNVSPIGRRSVEFAPLERVASKPNLALAAGVQIMDLAGDGKPDLVMFDGPTPGFYEHDSEEDWMPFRSFTSRLNRNTQDPNLKFIDLNGDGRADLLISEDEAFIWHDSLAEAGFGPARRVTQVLDEEQGPRLVFADGTQSIYLSDLSGDGLTDLVRIRNGEVCYWPNLGYGRFGAKVSMDNAPYFDNPDQFDHKRIRLADIDGSGAIDIIYLHRDGVRLYFNHSGNGWSEPQVLNIFPRVDDLVSIVPTDLLGNGTACLVWSSPLPGDARQPMRYVNLMGEQKPHLLIKTNNNLGAETEIQYAPSTKFYLQDKRDGQPWITKLPFPVHVVEKVTTKDKWRKTAFSSTYSYHHGYFDGFEREFRGFGRVEQVDIEDYGVFTQGNIDSPYITDDQTLYQPPIKTVTWFHTGAFLQRDKILNQFEHEYFPNNLTPDRQTPLGDFQEKQIPPPDLADADLTTQEWREALRACKGLTLRQEVYELDIDLLTTSLTGRADGGGEHRPTKLFSTAYTGCHINLLQNRGDNKHAVFLITQSEAITYNYEMDLRAEAGVIQPDPRIAHTLNLQTDDYGNVLQSVAAVYPRRQTYKDAGLPNGTDRLITRIQQETHLIYTENRFTNDVTSDISGDIDNYRLRLPSEVITYELTGITPPAGSDYFELQQLRDYRLSEVHQTEGTTVTDIAYHLIANHSTPQKRAVEQVRMLYFADDLETPLAQGILNSLALPYETYTLAMTDDLISSILGDRLSPAITTDLQTSELSGYQYNEAGNQYWIRSGIAGFATDAAEHFYLPERYTDPFGNITTLEYDNRDLFISRTTDPVGNRTQVIVFDYRVLQPSEMEDINGNLSEVIFDLLGLPTATAVKGKGEQADSLSGFTNELLNPDSTSHISFFTEAKTDAEPIAEYQQRQQDEARRLLGSASSRSLYYFGEVEETLDDGRKVIRWGVNPASACGIVREQHVAQLTAGETSPLQIGFEYSDGGGNVLVTKVQAESETEGGPLRWIANGKTILNNKGKPVKQYEPYFSESGHHFEEPREVGVTPVLYYDSAGRVIRTELPDGTFTKVEFTPWEMSSYDANDTVLESRWYRQNNRNFQNPAIEPPRDISGEIALTPDQLAGWLAAQHANTPAIVILDSLGREVISVAYNRVKNAVGVVQDEKTITFSKLDAEGKPLWIRDARGNLVMQYITPVKPARAADESDPMNPETIPAGSVPCYDIAGNLLFQHSMDGGERWMINDAAGQPFYAWDENERVTDGGAMISEDRGFHTTYDELRRPLAQQLRINGDAPQVVEQFVYGDKPGLFPIHLESEIPETQERNVRGQVYQKYDASGLITNTRFDFKGNSLEVQRQLSGAYQATIIDWSAGSSTSDLETEAFTQATEYDALNRMVRLENWHIEDREPAIYTPQYNQRGILFSETLTLRGRVTEAIRNIEYDANGQRQRIDNGNGTITRYEYDPKTFRLVQLRTTRNSDVLQQLSYTYDPGGNITEIYDDAYQPVFFRNQSVSPRSQYRYDALYRLVGATGREQYDATGAPPQRSSVDTPRVSFPISTPNDSNALRNYTQKYRYDSVGNIMQMRHSADRGGWTRNYAYADDSNRLLRTWLGGDEINAVQYNYDTHGSMLNLNRTPDAFNLRWDYRDMIYNVNLGGGGQAWYNYDNEKQRIRKRVERIGGAIEERFYLGGMELYRRKSAAGELVEEIETHHLFVDDQRVLIVEDVLQTNNLQLGVATLYKYQYSNHLGSVGLELDATGNIISYEEYHPYGTTAYGANSSAVRSTRKRYRYTGMERDEETGLSYHTARYYLSWLGRWVSTDPADLNDGLNVFFYANDNPVNFIDQLGMQAIQPVFNEDITLMLDSIFGTTDVPISSLLFRTSEELRADARREFGIPGLGVRSGRANTDGWEPYGRFHQRAALTRNGRTIPETVHRQLNNMGQQAQRHIEYTLNLFPEKRTGNEIIRSDIDLSLSLVIAPREGGIPGVFPDDSDENDRVISAGRDTHPGGVSGMDFLYNSINLFPESIREDITLVSHGYIAGREHRRAARLTRKNLLAAIIVTLEAGERSFVRSVSRLWGDEGEMQLLTLSEDARRTWIALGFAGAGYVNRAIKYLKDHALGLEDILTNSYLRRDFHVRGAIVTAARASMFDEIETQQLMEQYN
jgi:RHS repeat-associated protein